VRYHEVEALPEDGQYIALNVRPFPLARQEVARNGVMPESDKRISDNPRKLAGD
jgi:hypothetical protein